jgi:hypothetical protein
MLFRAYLRGTKQSKTIKLLRVFFTLLKIKHISMKKINTGRSSGNARTRTKTNVARYLFWGAVFVTLAAVLQHYMAYNFFYVEQWQLFVYEAEYWRAMLTVPGGFVRWIAEFTVQFFVYPYVGAVITAALFTLIGLLTAQTVRRLWGKILAEPLCLLPAVGLAHVWYANYSYAGMFAFCLCLLVLLRYVRLRGGAMRRTIYAVAAVGLLWWLTGAASVLFAACVALLEISRRRRCNIATMLLPAAAAALLAVLSVRMMFVGEWQDAVLPGAYYVVGEMKALAWVLLLAVLVAAWAMSQLRQTKWRQWLLLAAQVVIVTITLNTMLNKYLINPVDMLYKEVCYYNQNKQWKQILRLCKKHAASTNHIFFICLTNIALAEQGMLGEHMFAYNNGLSGLMKPYQRNVIESLDLSDLYYSMGLISKSQQMAFEVFESSGGHPRMLLRLIETNILFGAYPVAEKYITKLEHTLYYRDKAMAYRKFLYDDVAVAGDAVLGVKQRCIPKENFINSSEDRLYVNLQRIAEASPDAAHRTSLEYCGAIYLLMKTVDDFMLLLSQFYGTEALPTLPRAFQEAVLIAVARTQQPQLQQQLLERYNISQDIVGRFTEFNEQMMQNSNNPQLPALMRRNFGNTYWYYNMFRNVE